MKVYTSEIGYYRVHYRTDRQIKLPTGVNLKTIQTGPKIQRSQGFTPMLIPPKLGKKYKLLSNIIWKRE